MKKERISRWRIDIPRTLNLALGLLLALGASVAAFAQGGASGGITGTVKDPNGAGISGAQVEIISHETGVTERTVTTNSEGGFSITLLPIGSYRVVVTANGFSKTEAVNVKVKVTEITNVAIDLKIGGVAETITVSDTSTPVQVNTATTGQSLGSNTVGALPLATRNFLTLLTLSTGANTELFQSDALGRGAVTINVNGQCSAMMFLIASASTPSGPASRGAIISLTALTTSPRAAW